MLGLCAQAGICGYPQPGRPAHLRQIKGNPGARAHRAGARARLRQSYSADDRADRPRRAPGQGAP